MERSRFGLRRGLLLPLSPQIPSQTDSYLETLLTSNQTKHDMMPISHSALSDDRSDVEWRVTAAALKPSEVPPEVPTAPNSDLSIEWVYGYTPLSNHNNVRYTSNANIVYPAASLGVVYRKPSLGQRPSQEYHMEHHGHIISLAITPDLTKVATGGLQVEPFVVVWDAATTTTLRILKGLHHGAITHLDFSSDGTLLLAISREMEGKDSFMVVYKWAEGSKVSGLL